MDLTNQLSKAITADKVERFGLEARHYAFDTVEGKCVSRIRQVNHPKQPDLGEQNTEPLIYRD
jgi:hypothetical protein